MTCDFCGHKPIAGTVRGYRLCERCRKRLRDQDRKDRGERQALRRERRKQV